MLWTKVMAAVLAVASMLGTLAEPTLANPYAPRQYYGNWRRHATYSYTYRTYYYKPSPTYVGYRHHYVFSFPSRPKHYYFYNPYTKVFWGRCPVNAQGNGAYSLLAEGDRRGNVEDIPEEAFPKPGKMPRIPEATDDAPLDLPPDDLPGKDSLPEEKKTDK
jgi:hypothetical protein